MESIWKKDLHLPTFPKLESDIKTDVLIIGGGMAGLLCAYKMRKAGIDCVVAEADRICGGVTGNTTAKITVQHGLIYDKLINEYGIEAAQGYYFAQDNARKEYKSICSKIDCNFEEKPSVVYARSDRKCLEAEVRALERIGCTATLEEKLPLPLPTAGGVRIEGQAQFQPLKFIYRIADGLNIYEHTKICALIPGQAVTKAGKIKAKRIVVATHFPFLNKHGLYFMKLYQHRSYVIALKKAPKLDGMYVDENSKGMSFRSYEDMLLLGGGSHRTGKQGGCWQELEQFARTHYPNATCVARWATQDCMTLDGIPYIGQYSNNTPNLYVATGFNKWGMTSSMVAATILSDSVQGKKNDFAHIFDPSRSMLHPQLGINLMEFVKGILTPTAPRCPHLGCALKYNKAEHSWDCSCHGSRFAEDGKLLNNPATSDKKM